MRLVNSLKTYHVSAEQRQDQDAKRRRIERSGGDDAGDMKIATPSAKLGLTASTTSLSSLPQRADNFTAKADSIGLGAPRNAQSLESAPVAAQALAGSNRDVVANRAAIRMANMSAAEMLKAELSGLVPLKPSASAPKPEPVVPIPPKADDESMDDMDIPGLGNAPSALEVVADGADGMDFESSNPVALPVDEASPVAGVKRKLEDVEGEDADEVTAVDEESSEDNEDPSYALVIKADGSVEQADNVRYEKVLKISKAGNDTPSDYMSRAIRSDIINRSLVYQKTIMNSVESGRVRYRFLYKLG
jgi:5'-3' exoribonuclease 2